MIMNGIGAKTGVKNIGIAAAIALQMIIARPTAQGVVARTAVEGVVPIPAKYDVVASNAARSRSIQALVPGNLRLNPFVDSIRARGGEYAIFTLLQHQ